MGPWTAEMTIILRHMIADLNTPSTYADARLQQLILVAAQFVQTDIGLTPTYTVDIVNTAITPDPTMTVNGVSYRNDSFINLVLAKAACIIDNSEARLAAARGVAMRDANKSVDLRGVSEAKIKIWQKGWCQNYADMRLEYMAGMSGAAGVAIIGPFRESINMPAGPWTPDGRGPITGHAVGYGFQGSEYGRYR